MKKLIAMLLAVLMLAALFTGCAKTEELPEEEALETISPDVIPEGETSPETDDQPAAMPEAENEGEAAPETEELPISKPGETKPAEKPQAPEQNTESNTTPSQPPAVQMPEVKPEEPKEEASSGAATIGMELSAIIDAMYAIYNPILPAGTIPVDLADEFSLSSFTGLKDASLIKEAVASESMIGSQAYSVVLVRLNNAADAKTVANAMRNGIDQRKWVCVMADDIRVVAAGDVVMLCMIDSSFDVKVDTMVETFGSVVGTAFSVDIQ